jgi:hypothetical protein
MRPALFLAAALALGALPAAAAPADSVAATDIRCLLVSGALAQSDDQELKNIGTLSLFYFWGRLEGRGAPGDIVQRLIDESKKLTPDDVKTQAKGCADMSKSAGQKISDVSDALQKALAAAPASPPAAGPTPRGK